MGRCSGVTDSVFSVYQVATNSLCLKAAVKLFQCGPSARHFGHIPRLK